MSFPLPRNYYLLTHDALRLFVGKEAELSAFVKNRKPFQCDMLINSSMTDPLLAETNPNYVKEFCSLLQEKMGECSLNAFERRIEITFPDNEVLHLALGAPRKWLNGIQSPEEINQEPDWRLRNRLRISLGFDEALFTSCCSLGLNIAARYMEKWAYDFYKNRKLLLYSMKPEIFSKLDSDRFAVLPPVTYWQAHGYVLQQNYPCGAYQQVYETVRHNFAKYYKVYPFSNPYCEGEDLNTMKVVMDLCSLSSPQPLTTDEVGMELDLSVASLPEKNKPMPQ
ncbi:unnamed protein product [Phytomonas sp. EM1]|nr:unnamed protein product [Phytomonas sp. EM1]|eukprot:CCW61106.1 unnamed protein product [Phytomonas sp. isolate EM1]